jgi:hypothetical protein
LINAQKKTKPLPSVSKPTNDPQLDVNEIGRILESVSGDSAKLAILSHMIKYFSRVSIKPIVEHVLGDLSYQSSKREFIELMQKAGYDNIVKDELEKLKIVEEEANEKTKQQLSGAQIIKTGNKVTIMIGGGYISLDTNGNFTMMNCSLNGNFSIMAIKDYAHKLLHSE